MYGVFCCIYVCEPPVCVPGAVRGQKRTLYLLGLKLHTVMSHYVGAGH